MPAPVPEETDADFDQAVKNIGALSDADQTELVSRIVLEEIPIFKKAEISTDGMEELATALHNFATKLDTASAEEVCAPGNVVFAPKLAKAFKILADAPWTAEAQDGRTGAEMAEVDSGLMFASGYLGALPKACRETEKPSKHRHPRHVPSPQQPKGMFQL